MIGSSRSYAIGMGHFQIAGGIKSLIGVCVTYLAIFCAFLGLYLYFDSKHPFPAGITSVAVSLLFLVQSVVLLIFGTLRVSGSVRMDLTNKMIESHRLMPVTSWRAVAGY